jgi:hypothetical protein
MKWSSLLAIPLCFVLSNCKKNEAGVSEYHDTNILAYSIKNTPAEVSIEPSQHLINIKFPDSVMNADDLVADFTLSPGCKATIKDIEQVSGFSKNSYAKIFFYTVSASGSSTDWKVTATNNNYTADEGLGNFVQQIAKNDRPYSWYMDQAYTGPFSDANCGPAAVSMACKWADSAFSKTPEDARNAYRPAGGDWYADDITFYLRDNGIPNSTLALPATAETVQDVLKQQVDLHQLVILTLEMISVRYNGFPQSHVDRFYETKAGIGHYLLIKGYIKVDNEMYFQVYDPNSWTRMYDDGSLKGKDRYYRSEELFAATKTWWPKVFLVAKKGTAIID